MEKFNELTVNYMTTSGAFLSSGKKANVMTISWGGVGVFWGQKVAIVPVRYSRYTKEFIDKTGYFAVSVPYGDKKEALKYCGTHSGRDTDKIKETGLVLKDCEFAPTQYVDGCGEVYECKTLAVIPLSLDMLPQELHQFYDNNDLHCLYIGKILN